MEKRAKKQQEEMIKRFNKAAEEAGEGPMSLPPAYLPSAWACLALFTTLTLHALFFLLGHWMVGFKAWSLYDHAGKKVDKSCFLLVTPPEIGVRQAWSQFMRPCLVTVCKQSSNDRHIAILLLPNLVLWVQRGFRMAYLR